MEKFLFCIVFFQVLAFLITLYIYNKATSINHLKQSVLKNGEINYGENLKYRRLKFLKIGVVVDKMLKFNNKKLLFPQQKIKNMCKEIKNYAIEIDGMVQKNSKLFRCFGKNRLTYVEVISNRTADFFIENMKSMSVEKSGIVKMLDCFALSCRLIKKERAVFELLFCRAVLINLLIFNVEIENFKKQIIAGERCRKWTGGCVNSPFAYGVCTRNSSALKVVKSESKKWVEIARNFVKELHEYDYLITNLLQTLFVLKTKNT